ncbi:NAD(P)H-dependent oxidoreductase [Candidatus Saccharibacteria bacterium]|nr:NAD(P)H-dependent oxidoreductase [Candidatus Saccharibacteria bacterium]
MKLIVVIGSTRPGRVSERVAKWVAKEAANLPGTKVDLVDLKDYPMPLFDEPKSPRYNPERKPSVVVQKWMDKIAEGEAYVFVTPEYNHSIPGVLKNALDYITVELTKKPATVVSQGSVGGARAIVHLKEVLSESGAAITPRQVALSAAAEKLNEEGELSEEVKAQPYGPAAALHSLLEELRWYSDALSAARAK